MTSLVEILLTSSSSVPSKGYLPFLLFDERKRSVRNGEWDLETRIDQKPDSVQLAGKQAEKRGEIESRG